MPWCVSVKLQKNGNSTMVTIPRPFLDRLKWATGRGVILELDEDCATLLVRLPRASDFGPDTPPVLHTRPASEAV